MTTLMLGAAACDRGRTPAAPPVDAASQARETRGREITVTGCLTGAPDRNAFVVTADRNALTSGALYSGSGEVPTYTYELVATGSDLAPHVGRQVQVVGRLDADRDDEVDVEARTEHADAGRDSKVTPAVETNEEIEIKVRRIHVVSVTETGTACR